MRKHTKATIQKLGTIEAMVLCNKLGLPEGTGEEMRQALLEHYEFTEGEPVED